MQSKKLPKRLFKNRDVVHTYEHDRATRGAIKHVTRDHLDVLQNIEFTLVALARKDPAIDDAVIDRALHNCLAGAKLPEDADSSLVRLCDRLRDAVAPQGCVGPGLDRLPEENPEISPPAFQPGARRNRLPRVRWTLRELERIARRHSARALNARKSPTT